MAGGPKPKRLTTPRRKKPAAAQLPVPHPGDGQTAAPRERSRSLELPSGSRRGPPTTPVLVISDSEPLEDDRNWAPNLDEFDDIDDMRRAKRDWERYLVQKARMIGAGAPETDLKKLLREYIDRDMDASTKSDSEERERLEAARAIMEVDECEKADMNRREAALEAAHQEGVRAQEQAARERAEEEARRAPRRERIRADALEPARELEEIVERNEAAKKEQIRLEEETRAREGDADDPIAESATPPAAQRDPQGVNSPRGSRVLESPPKRTRRLSTDLSEGSTAHEEEHGDDHVRRLLPLPPEDKDETPAAPCASRLRTPSGSSGEPTLTVSFSDRMDFKTSRRRRSSTTR